MISREIALRQAGDDSVVTDDRGELPPVHYIGYNQVQNNVIQNNSIFQLLEYTNVLPTAPM